MSSIDAEPRLRVLSIRQRYVARARYLKKYAPFRRDIDQRRAEWDATWPDFAIGIPGTRPPRPKFSAGSYSLAPPKLNAAMLCLGDWLQGKRPRPKPRDFSTEQTLRADWAWRQLLGSICD